MNAPELKVVITRKGRTNRSLAKTIGVSEQAFYNKLNGKSEFRASEIAAIARELELSLCEINDIFFTKA